MANMASEKEAKLLRLRDITIYHLDRLCPTMAHEQKVQAIEDLEHDIKVWVKNFLMTCEELHVSPDVTWVGDNNSDRDSIVRG